MKSFGQVIDICTWSLEQSDIPVVEFKRRLMHDLETRKLFEGCLMPSCITLLVKSPQPGGNIM